MAISASRVTVNTSADLITGDEELNGFRICVRNRGSVAVYLGGSAVTTADGFQLDAGESVSFYVDAPEQMYGVTASGEAELHVLKGGV